LEVLLAVAACRSPAEPSTSCLEEVGSLNHESGNAPAEFVSGCKEKTWLVTAVTDRQYGVHIPFLSTRWNSAFAPTFWLGRTGEFEFSSEVPSLSADKQRVTEP